MPVLATMVLPACLFRDGFSFRYAGSRGFGLERMAVEYRDDEFDVVDDDGLGLVDRDDLRDRDDDRSEAGEWSVVLPEKAAIGAKYPTRTSLERLEPRRAANYDRRGRWASSWESGAVPVPWLFPRCLAEPDSCGR